MLLDELKDLLTSEKKDLDWATEANYFSMEVCFESIDAEQSERRELFGIMRKLRHEVMQITDEYSRRMRARLKRLATDIYLEDRGASRLEFAMNGKYI